MRRADVIFSRQIGDGARHLEHAVVGARGQSQAEHLSDLMQKYGLVEQAVPADKLVEGGS